MMREIKPKESSEIKSSESNKYKEIKPENGMTYPESKEFWKEKFSEKNEETQADKTHCDNKGEKYHEGNTLEPNTRIEKNGYTYRTDSMGRVISAEGKLQVKDHPGKKNIRVSKDVVAHGKMAESDEKGHLIADQFNGSSGLENLVPMDKTLNHGDYKKLENTLAKAVKDGADVRMKVEPVYNGDSYRPDEIRVSYTIDGDKEVVVFKNRSDK